MPGVLPEVIILAAAALEEAIVLHPQDQGHLVHPLDPLVRLLVHPVQEEEEGNIILSYL